MPALQQELTVKMLSKSPSVLSIGRLVAEQGFSLIWIAGQKPRLWTAEGNEVKMRVQQFVPAVDNLASFVMPAGQDDEDEATQSGGEESLSDDDSDSDGSALTEGGLQSDGEGFPLPPGTSGEEPDDGASVKRRSRSR